MRFGVVRFPGSNCDLDCAYAIGIILGADVAIVDYRYDDRLTGEFDCMVLPGGFSYGDYLRPGAVAKAAPIMSSLGKFARNGGLVVGICNGFQVLLEAGWLPGVLLPNRQGHFLCDRVGVRVLDTATPFTNLYEPNEILTLPIAHASGNYHVSAEELGEVRIVCKYTSDVNGSKANIAAIANPKGNILGIMPHPERACELDKSCGEDGLRFWQSLLKWQLLAT